MSLAAGTRLGPYEIVAPLGAGGMGEVYRAKDTRLGRQVAIKVLPKSFSQDADRLRRFEQEARAASALNHPNIVTLHDVGQNEGAPYVVTELLEGETLRSRLATGATSSRKATEYAIQIANGLAAAHEKGIVHRDLKPENLFVTEDGRVKILDFGLAKLIQPEGVASPQTSIPTASVGTEPGVVMGTVGYMSPEQVKGQPADHRSDIFSFGAILYEMLSGRRAFRGDSAVETMSAILKEEPPDLSETNKNLSPGLESLVRHCLEKSPAQRFQSARDLAYDLETLSGTSASRLEKPAIAVRSGRLARTTVVVFGLGTIAAGLFFLLPRFARPSPVTYRQLTFRPGLIYGARFGPEGQSVVYSAYWGGAPPHVYSVRPESPESNALTLPESFLFAVSSKAELAVALKPVSELGTLARAPLSGGAPREILSGVRSADWSPDGTDLAVAHDVGGKTRLEYPVGKALYQSTGLIDSVRVSPQGDLVAMVDHPVRGDTVGSLLVIDHAGKSRVLSSGWSGITAACWSPGGDEIWFSGSSSGVRLSLWAVTLSGKQRLLQDSPASLVLMDVSRSGRALVAQASYRASMVGVPAGETTERDVSWLDFSTPVELSVDGRTLLFEEWGEGGGPKGSIYLQRFDGTPPVRLGDGLAFGLSPDGQWVLARLYSDPPRLVLLPTGPGQPRPLVLAKGLQIEEWGAFLPDGMNVVFTGHEPGGGSRIYVQNLTGGMPKVASRDEPSIGAGAADAKVSPDGSLVAAHGPDNLLRLYPLNGGDSRPVFGAEPGEHALQWTPDGRKVYVCALAGARIPVFLLDLASGKRELWREFRADPAGLLPENTAIVLTRDGKSWFTSYQHILGELYLAEGLR